MYISTSILKYIRIGNFTLHSLNRLYNRIHIEQCANRIQFKLRLKRKLNSHMLKFFAVFNFRPRAPILPNFYVKST